MHSPLKVLFLCTEDSARSILGETYLDASGAARVDDIGRTWGPTPG